MQGASDSFACEHGQRCGGCALLGVPVAQQLGRKRAAVRDALGCYPALQAVATDEVVAAQPMTGYRTRAKLVVSPSGEIGLYARGTHDVIDIPHCQVLSPRLLAVVDAVRQRVHASRLPLRGLDAREVSGPKTAGVLLSVLGQTRDRVALEAFAHECMQIEGVLGTSFGAQERGATQLLGEAPVHVAGAAMLADVLTTGGPYHYVSAGSFVQAHRGQAQALAQRVLSQLQTCLGTLRGARVLELYAGSGALGLLLRQAGARPLLVERYEPALALLAQAAAEQKLEGIATRPGDAETVLGDLVAAHERFDVVIVNPPRRGLTPPVRAHLAALEPRAVVYVSCDPQTLARDLSDLALRGLRAT
ncbi:MAG TPA: RsmD family RNA methyltransferase, partial [Polyangiales bacterium]